MIDIPRKPRDLKLEPLEPREPRPWVDQVFDRDSSPKVRTCLERRPNAVKMDIDDFNELIESNPVQGCLGYSQLNDLNDKPKNLILHENVGLIWAEEQDGWLWWAKT